MANDLKPVASYGHFEKFYPRNGDQTMLVTVAVDLALLDANKKLAILELHTKNIFFIMCEAELKMPDVAAALEGVKTPEALPPVSTKESGKKISHSQELRLIFRDIHFEQGGNDETFQEYYDNMMVNVKAHYRKKLNELQKQKQ